MDVEIIQETCYSCNVIFWITVEHYEKLRRCKNIFYCPNGHPQNYKGKTDTQKAADLERDLRYAKRELLNLARSNSALRGVITKNKKSS